MLILQLLLPALCFFLCLEFFLYRLSFSQSNRQEDKGFYQQNNFLTSPDWDEFVMSVFYSAAIAAFVVLVVCILLYFVVAMIEGQLSFDLICQLLPWLWNLSKGERLRLFAEKLPGAAAYRMVQMLQPFTITRCSLRPIITGHVYQKFYTQFVHARCTVCKTSSSIPTLCLLCGTFLCCNSECCRRPLGENGQMVGEVTQHAQVCGFGTCVFLQLSNSLVHIVADGFITCWGSLYLDGHGEEEYNLSRPLHISEVRLHQLTQLIREVSFDFESRLKWKKVILV
ncbi:unnamed protein product [Durusdinium trenchii]|uniref:E3 ubiquitin-protein ligase n=1 Tax=Durusdinium trenchii TaxID=1381693 RepID=A0ABP0LJ78_9DINO